MALRREDMLADPAASRGLPTATPARAASASGSAHGARPTAEFGEGTRCRVETAQAVGTGAGWRRRRTKVGERYAGEVYGSTAKRGRNSV